MKVVVTGSSGFIGSAPSIRLLERGNVVVGLDNHNDYYDPALKIARLARHLHHANYHHVGMNLEDRHAVARLFADENFDCVFNLAAQAGVRYSIDNPMAYIDSNILGFANILEECRNSSIKHLVFASSSSVYGLNTKQLFSTQDGVDHPVSFYAATKKSNELMAHSYSHLYNIPTTGLRFFYGVWPI
jgi:UDP-glucuronate 4-epimerase